MQSITIDGREFWLQPKGRGVGSELLRFDDPQLDGFREYQYTALPQNKKMIRLIKLHTRAKRGACAYTVSF